MRRAGALPLFVLLAGCSLNSTSGTRSSVDRSDFVVGPHGEALTEVQCWTLAECMSTARAACGGDFDVVVTGVVGASHGTWPEMLVGCLQQPDAGVLWAPDGGS